MNRFKSLKSQVAVAVTFVALGLAGIFIQADQAGAQNGPKHEPTTHPVDIVSPLPLPVTVDGTVTGTVAATQSGEWNVGIPAVVSVKNIDEKGRNPYFVSLHCETRNGNSCIVSAAAVPAGHRLVIEQVNATIQLRNPNTVQAFLVTVDNAIRAEMPTVTGWNSGVHTNFSLNEPTLIFVEAGQAPGMGFSGTNIDVNATMRLSGYLIDLAQ